jgi:adhesin transport system outer membrane protein
MRTDNLKKGECMFKKNLLSFVCVISLYSINSFAGSLQQDIVEVLNTNPTIQERLKNFRATQQDLNVAEAEYYPSLDLRVAGGYNKSGHIKDNDLSSDDDWNHGVRDQSWRSYESSLTFTQNLFDGFSTMHKVDFEETRILAAAYKYLETSNDMAFKMTEAYINVLKTNDLVGTARENVQINESIYNKVKDLFESGLTTDSEVKKIQATLSLARSNLTVQKNNARDAAVSYRRILGRMPDINSMQNPNLDISMPQSMEKAALYSIEHNPSLLVSKYNIKGAQALWKQRKKEYYPKLDLEISQSLNDHDKYLNGFDQADDRFKARLVLTYNLFRGGADKATIQKHLSKVAQELEIQRVLKREVIEGLDLSWNAYDMIEAQLKDLRDYSRFSEKTLELYKEEYDLGRRSLLDLLSAQNDVINSRSQIIKAEYDKQFAQYRVLDAMGLLVIAINGSADEFTSKVNLYSDAQAQEILDTEVIELDADKDKIPDSVDLCDNSLKEDNIMPYGCKKPLLDEDKDGVVDEKDECPLTPLGIKVDKAGCELDSDKDGIKDSLDSCPNTPFGYEVDKKGCSKLVVMTVEFKKYSTDVPPELDAKIQEFVDFLNDNGDVKAHIVGHTSKEQGSVESVNIKISKQRADSIAKKLILLGISADRITTEGVGFAEPIADNSTKEGRALNRRVEIKLSRENEEEAL